MFIKFYIVAYTYIFFHYRQCCSGLTSLNNLITAVLILGWGRTIRSPKTIPPLWYRLSYARVLKLANYGVLCRERPR